MKKFLIRFLLFSLPVIILMMAAEWAVRHRPNPYRYKYEYLTTHGSDVEILILGNSHTYEAFVPDELPRPAFNAALMAQTTHYDYLILEKFQPLMPHLRVVIMSVGYNTFADNPYMEKGDDWFRVINYELYMHLNQHSPLSRYHFEMAHGFGFTKKLKDVLTGHNSLRWDSLGHSMDFPYAEVDKAKWMSEAKEHVAMLRRPGNKYFFDNLTCLQMMADLCRRHHVKLFLVSTPLHETFRNNMDSEQWQMMLQGIAKLQEAYPEVKWFDYSADTRFDADDFNDPSHLNDDRGARKFTRIFVKEHAKEL